VQKGDRESIGRLEMERDGTHLGFWLGPSLIDGSFQASMALADADVGIGTLKIPLSIKRLQPTGRPYSIAVWSYFQLIDFTDRTTVFRSWLLNDAGEALLYFDHVHLQEVRDEHIQKVLQSSGRQGTEQQLLYSVEWRALEPQPQMLPATGASEQWLVLGQSEILTRLDLSKDSRCRCVTHGTAGGLDVESDVAKLQSLLAEKQWAAVVLVDGLLHDTASDVDVLTFALQLVKAAIQEPAKAPPLWLATWGAQPLASQDEEVRKVGRTEHSGLWGFARAVRMEYPGALQVKTLDLDASGGSLGPALTDALAALATTQDEEELAVRASGTCSSAKLVRSSLKFSGPSRLNMAARGALSNLKLVPQADRRPVIPGFVQMRIRAVGLNFRDVLNVMGLYPGDPGPPGADAAGTVLELGDRVNTLRICEDVFGECPGCLSTYHAGPAALLATKPSSWSFEDACAMPVIFVTVEESLGDLAKLKKGERVLIHAAAGGVGLVAIQYAKHVGAEVFATAGAQEKHDFLRNLGVKYITSSRSGAQFEEDMKRFLKEAGADGVDVVLNSLSHDDYIPRSLAVLRKGGRFMEIGKRGVWSHEAMWEQRPDIMYEKIVADTMMEKEPWKYNAYLKRLLTRVDEGGLQPINSHHFAGLERGVAAMQFLQRANNIGKVVISEPSRMGCRPDSTALLSGGMGALGVVTAQFLAEEGCKSLCLLSRAGKPSSDVMQQWEWLQASMATINVQKCDVSQEASVLELQKALKSPVHSLLHLAGVLVDGMLPALTRECFEKSYAPKVHGLRYLDKLSYEDNAEFLLFSSTSALFGSPGQANYSASNSVLDALAPQWTAQGHRQARSIQWGPWAEVGMAVQKNTLQRAKAMGVGALSTVHGMSIMGSLIASSDCVVGAVPVKWSKYLRSAYQEVPPFLVDLEAEVKRDAPNKGAAGGEGQMSYAGLTAEERLQAVRTSLRDMARQVVDNQDLEADEPLLESGMDSLSGVEFRNRLVTEFEGIRMPNSLIFDYPTVNALAEFISDKLGDAAPAPALQEDSAGAAAAPASTDATAELLERLNERAVGAPIFLVPGAGFQAGGFRSLASLLPVPAYGLSWPKGARPRTEWPASLEDLADLFLQEIMKVQPTGPYFFAGHSFGATVCTEMARIMESRGGKVSVLALLDPRSLPPFTVDIAGAFSKTGLVDSLALLAQTVPDGSKYANLLQEVSQLESKEHDAAVRRSLNPAALASLEHVHETTKWYSGLLQGVAQGGDPGSLRAGQVAVLHAAETWRQAPAEGATESTAEAMVRTFQAATFQTDAEVAQRLKGKRAKKLPATMQLRVPGTHFSMLHEPHCATLARRLCRVLDEATGDEEAA